MLAYQGINGGNASSLTSKLTIEILESFALCALSTAVMRIMLLGLSKKPQNLIRCCGTTIGTVNAQPLIKLPYQRHFLITLTLTSGLINVRS